MIGSRDERSRAIAIESLSSLPQRRFVVPILPLIEGNRTAPTERSSGKPDLAMLAEALRSADPWLRAAAAVAWHGQTGKVPVDMSEDPSPIVAETARQLAQRRAASPCPYAREVRMSRLSFLHSVRLFAETSLDDLIAVDEVLSSHLYLAREAIITEGEAGDRLCIIHSGTVEVRKGGHVLARLGAGDFFGEMALFDDGPRSATVVALDDVEVLALERDRFHSLVRQRPSVLMEVCRTLVLRLRQTEQDAAPAN
jgi:CRP-like cAMP-binding protein